MQNNRQDIIIKNKSFLLIKSLDFLYLKMIENNKIIRANGKASILQVLTSDKTAGDVKNIVIAALCTGKYFIAKVIIKVQNNKLKNLIEYKVRYGLKSNALANNIPMTCGI